MSPGEAFRPYVGAEVVLDTRGALLYIGRLHEISGDAAVLRDVDAHDMTDSRTSKEVYTLESRKFGIKANRKEARVLLSEIIGMSRLEDVIPY